MSQNHTDRPIIGITMGDGAGVGPELCLRALASKAVRAICRPVVLGDAALLDRVADAAGLEGVTEVVPWNEWDGSCPAAGLVLDYAALDAAAVECGIVQEACGSAAYRYIEAAIGAAREGRIGGMVTCPIHKEALRLAGIAYPGHTEILAAHTATKEYCMMLASDDITVSLVTTHLALERVGAAITADRIGSVIRLTHDAMQRMGQPHPRITVCGLNPHAGERGLFGDEEGAHILPAIEEARRIGMRVTGPLPPDTAFVPRRLAETDAYIVMYHDQGLIPFKMLAFDKGVNVTLGLPIVRTSVDHGTAFDIAWQGTASAESLIHAIAYAVKLVATV